MLCWRHRRKRHCSGKPPQKTGRQNSQTQVRNIPSPTPWISSPHLTMHPISHPHSHMKSWNPPPHPCHRKFQLPTPHKESPLPLPQFLWRHGAGGATASWRIRPPWGLRIPIDPHWGGGGRARPPDPNPQPQEGGGGRDPDSPNPNPHQERGGGRATHSTPRGASYPTRVAPPRPGAADTSPTRGEVSTIDPIPSSLSTPPFLIYEFFVQLALY